MATLPPACDPISYTTETESLTIGAFVIAGVCVAATVAVLVLFLFERSTSRQLAMERDAAIARSARAELLHELGHGAAAKREPAPPASATTSAQFRRLRFEDPVRRVVDTMKRDSARHVVQWALLAKIWRHVSTRDLQQRYYLLWVAAARAKRDAAGRAATGIVQYRLHTLADDPPYATRSAASEAPLRSVSAPWQQQVTAPSNEPFMSARRSHPRLPTYGEA